MQEKATVPVKSALLSKINWTQVGALSISFATWASGMLPPEQAAAAALIIQAAQSVATVVFRTWFNKSVAPNSL